MDTVTLASGVPARVVSGVSPEVWREIFESDPGAVVTQSPAWREALFSSGRYEDASLLFEFDSGSEVVLPMARPKSPLVRGSSAASWPQRWGIGGPFCRHGRAEPAEMEAVLAHAASLRAITTEIHLRPGIDPRWREAGRRFAVTEYSQTSYMTDLSGGFDVVWGTRASSRARRASRQAERAGIEVEVDTTGRLLEEYFALYELAMTRWAEKQHEPLWLTRWRTLRVASHEMIASVVRTFASDCALYVARLNGEVAAALIVLSAGSYAKCWKAAMNKELAGPTHANELLDRLAIEQACKEGRRFYDLGFTRPDSPLAKFKEKIGATPTPTYLLRRERLPVSRAVDSSRALAKRLIGFRDV